MTDPITHQRSQWEETGEPGPLGFGQWWLRNVSDGTLAAVAAEEPEIGWHLSISFRDHKGNLTRYPTWDEITHARYELLPPELTFVMMLPPMDDYISVHRTTFHLHQFPPP